jgi:hypothetical protein
MSEYIAVALRRFVCARANIAYFLTWMIFSHSNTITLLQKNMG